MKRHPFNLFSLTFGIFLILLAAWTTWIAFPVRGWFIDSPRLLLPAVAILAGAALMSPLFTPKQQKAPRDETEDYPSEASADTPPDHS